ncbi:PREDICTED: cancer/testis antigen 47B-like [Chrysochloris asiatica]|uniref:Cancer/testis antigen 47B-like n=1 Tax=Chrysochloris asiatica TaxID=185453 RepID=A0A9B0WV06_CHRAS|nr:PREDICTED: cancer/testis antigen 47B-like [Chrysochloris asiatica]
MSATNEPDQDLGAQLGVGDVAGAGSRVADEPGLVGAGAPGAVQEQGVPAGSGSQAQEVQMSREDSNIGPAEEEGAVAEEANPARVVDVHQLPIASSQFDFHKLIHSMLRRQYHQNHVVIWPRDSPIGRRQPQSFRFRCRGSGYRGGGQGHGSQGQSWGPGAGEDPSWSALPQLDYVPSQAPAPGPTEPGEPSNQTQQAPEQEQPEDASHQASAPQLDAAQPGTSQSQWAALQEDEEAAQYQHENSDEKAPKPGGEEEKEAEEETEKEAEEKIEKEPEKENKKEKEQEPTKNLDGAEGRPGSSRYL